MIEAFIRLQWIFEQILLKITRCSEKVSNFFIKTLIVYFWLLALKSSSWFELVELFIKVANVANQKNDHYKAKDDQNSKKL